MKNISILKLPKIKDIICDYTKIPFLYYFHTIVYNDADYIGFGYNLNAYVAIPKNHPIVNYCINEACNFYNKKYKGKYYNIYSWIDKPMKNFCCFDINNIYVMNKDNLKIELKSNTWLQTIDKIEFNDEYILNTPVRTKEWFETSRKYVSIIRELCKNKFIIGWTYEHKSLNPFISCSNPIIVWERNSINRSIFHIIKHLKQFYHHCIKCNKTFNTNNPYKGKNPKCIKCRKINNY